MPRRREGPQPETIHCAQPECDETIVRSKWDKIRSDWFFQKDGSAWCPEHTPDWVAQWRLGKMMKQGREQESD